MVFLRYISKFAIIPAAFAWRVPVLLESNKLSTSDVCEKVLPAVFKVYSRSKKNGEWIKSGTGFFIKNDGTGITAYHVVECDGNFTAVLQSGKEYPIEILKTDRFTDFALIKAKIPHSVPFILLGDSDKTKLGDQTICFGFNSFTKLYPEIIFSNIIDWKQEFQKVIKCDTESTKFSSNLGVTLLTQTMIRPGFSGGPIVNDKGEAIGFSISKSSRNEDNLVDYISYHTPINAVKEYIYQHKDDYDLEPPALGITVKNHDSGVTIIKVEKDLLAHKAGLQDKDAIVELNGKKINGVKALLKEIKQNKGVALDFKFIREKTEMRTKLSA